MMQATLLGVRLREGTDRQGNPRVYYNADLYTEAGSGNVSIDETIYGKLKEVPMGTPVRILPRWSVYQGRADLRVADVEPVNGKAS